MNRSLTAAVVAMTALSVAVASPAAPRKRSPAARFSAPVKLTPENAGGYEPGLTTDKFGNLYVTAHKENAELIASPDSGSPTMTRSMSWKWMSGTDGKTWHEIPGLPLNLENHDFGDEGDLAVDSGNHLYFVDTNVGDVTFTRWTINGKDKVTFDTHRPALPAGEGVDDRPWITAHGNGDVYYLGNQGDKVTYPLGTQQGAGKDDQDNAGGRYTLYASHNAGDTFDSLGITLSGSGWCRPEADPRSSYVYVLCTDDGGRSGVADPIDPGEDMGRLYAYVSPDKGATWKRYTIGQYHTNDPGNTWPSVQVAKDGSISMLYLDATSVTTSHPSVGSPTHSAPSNTFALYRSTTHGKTWTRTDVTPETGKYHYSWMSVAPDGKTLGMTAYRRSAQDSKWRVYATIFKPGTTPVWTSLDEQNPVAAETASSPPGDFLECRFSPDGALNVVWTRNALRPGGAATLLRDIYFARSTTKAPIR